MAKGFLSDPFGHGALGGDGGQGGNGGIGGQGGNGGDVGQDVMLVEPDAGTATGEVFELTGYRTGEASVDPAFWVGVLAEDNRATLLTERVLADVFFFDTTAAGIGGDGGLGGNGGAAGANGGGGHAAVIVNYGILTGDAAFGLQRTITAG
jgi:hypothetical protein